MERVKKNLFIIVALICLLISNLSNCSAGTVQQLSNKTPDEILSQCGDFINFLLGNNKYNYGERTLFGEKGTLYAVNNSKVDIGAFFLCNKAGKVMMICIWDGDKSEGFWMLAHDVLSTAIEIPRDLDNEVVQKIQKAIKQHTTEQVIIKGNIYCISGGAEGKVPFPDKYGIVMYKISG